MGLLGILSVAAIFCVGANFYAYKRFIKKIAFFNAYLFYVRLFFYAVAAIEFIFFLQIRFAFLSVGAYLIAGALVAFSLFLFGVSLIYDVLRVVFRRAKFSQSRRKFIKICFDVTFLVLLFSYFFKGMFNALTPPRVHRTEIIIKNLKEPMRLAVISDVHIGEFLQKEFLAALVYQINAQKPDAVAIVGDLIDFSADKIGDFLEPLKDLRSKYGTFYVTGNHEYYHGAREILPKISAAGAQILANAHARIGGINLAGVHDLAGIRFGYLAPDLGAALAGRDEDRPTVLLAHQPKFLQTMRGNEVDLVVCGHTHGGQIFPFQLLVLLDQKLLRGLYRLNDKMQAYVSSGAGFWGPPVRILAPSEIAILDLKGE